MCRRDKLDKQIVSPIKSFLDLFQQHSYWAYVATFTFFILAMVIALLWLVLGKRKSVPPAFFEFVFVVARYFGAFELLFYGIEKLDGIQFTIQAERLIPSGGSSDPFNQRPKVVWIQPELWCEVKYLELDHFGVMRHPSFKGLL